MFLYLACHSMHSEGGSIPVCLSLWSGAGDWVIKGRCLDGQAQLGYSTSSACVSLFKVIISKCYFFYRWPFAKPVLPWKFNYVCTCKFSQNLNVGENFLPGKRCENPEGVFCDVAGKLYYQEKLLTNLLILVRPFQKRMLLCT